MRLRKLLMVAGSGAADSAEFSPDQVSGLALWFDPSQIGTLFQDDARSTPVTADAQAIGGIADLSGNAKHAAQSSAGLKGVYKANIFNGLGVIRAGGGMRLDVSSFTLDSFTAFFVIKATANGLIYEHGPGTNGTPGSFFYTTLASSSSIAHVAVHTGSSSLSRIELTSNWGLLGNQKVFTQHFPNANYPTSGIYINDVFQSASISTDCTEPFASVTNTLYLGQRTGGVAPITADYGEILFYSPSLSEADRASITSYLITKWGVT